VCRPAVCLVLLALAAPAAQPPTPVDLQDDPLPPGATARVGTVRLRHADGASTVAYSPASPGPNARSDP
jgi:hypothetical protein